jgi:hypothetical protein
MTLDFFVLSAPYLLPQPLALSGHHSLFLLDLVLFLADLPNLGLHTGNECLLMPQLVPVLVTLPPCCLKYVAQTVSNPLAMLRQQLIEVTQDGFKVECK